MNVHHHSWRTYWSAVGPAWRRLRQQVCDDCNAHRRQERIWHLWWVTIKEWRGR